MDAIALLTPHLRSEPNAAEFAQYLADNVPGILHAADGLGQYAWEADIPPQAEWPTHAAEFAAHLESL